MLSKSRCPIVGLSLFNFVPSCPICNERLKGTGVLGKDATEMSSLSPTSSTYNFDNSVEISVTPKDTFAILNSQARPDDFKITFHYNNPLYQNLLICFTFGNATTITKVKRCRLI